MTETKRRVHARIIFPNADDHRITEDRRLLRRMTDVFELTGIHWMYAIICPYCQRDALRAYCAQYACMTDTFVSMNSDKEGKLADVLRTYAGSVTVIPVHIADPTNALAIISRVYVDGREDDMRLLSAGPETIFREAALFAGDLIGRRDPVIHRNMEFYRVTIRGEAPQPSRSV